MQRRHEIQHGLRRGGRPGRAAVHADAAAGTDMKGAMRPRRSAARALTHTHATHCCIASPPQFPNWTKLAAYQACEHALAKYIAQLQPYKISLPSGVLRDFKC